MPLCNRCGGFKQLANDQCECGILIADVQQLPVAEAAPGLSDNHYRTLGLLDLGYTRSEVVTAFGGDLVAELTVQYAWAFLQGRGLVDSGITERGRELVRIYAKGSA